MQLKRLTADTAPPARVLVVDDEEVICSLLARTLRPMGYSVDVAMDADTALDCMQERPADVAVVDIKMPGHDGVWLIERLQERHPETAVVILTGIRDLDPRLTLRPAVIGYLTKPFTAKRVREVVEEAVASARALTPNAPARPSLPTGISEEDIAGLPDLDDDGEEKP